MEFALNDEQQALRDMLRTFVAKEVRPKAAEWDASAEFPRETVAKLGDLGHPRGDGPRGVRRIRDGHGQLRRRGGRDLEGGRIARLDGGVPQLPLHRPHPRFRVGIREAEIPSRTGVRKNPRGLGPHRGRFRFRSLGMRTKAEWKKDRWVINGSKMFITQGNVAGVYVVLAVTDREKGKDGVTAFVFPARTKGLSVGRKLHKLGMRSSDTAELVFEDLEVGPDAVVGQVDSGFRDTMKNLAGGTDLDRGPLGGNRHRGDARGVGLFERACAVRTPGVGVPGDPAMFADMGTELEAAELMTFRAASQGRRATVHPRSGDGQISHPRRGCGRRSRRSRSSAGTVYAGLSSGTRT